MATIESIWSPADDRAQAALLDALAQDDLTAAMLAIEGLEGPRAEACHRQLRAWGNEARHRSARRGGHLLADTLAEILVDEADLRGDIDRYHDADNSLLSQVLDRRRGLPILLSSIWMVVGRHAGASVEGLGMPGHFIVRVQGQLRDPFDRGRRLTPVDCARIVSTLTRGQLPWSDDFLAPVTTAQLIERMLRNLINTHTRDKAPAPLYRAVRLTAAIGPSPPNKLMHGRVAENLGAHRLAIQVYEGLLEDHPLSDEARIAEHLLGPLQKRAEMLN